MSGQPARFTHFDAYMDSYREDDDASEFAVGRATVVASLPEAEALAGKRGEKGIYDIAGHRNIWLLQG